MCYYNINLILKLKKQSMRNQCRSSALSLCSHKEAEMSFFPIIHSSDKRYVMPETARKETFVGIAMLLPIVPHRMILNAVNGRTEFTDKIPLGFTTFSPCENRSMENIDMYWEQLLDTKKKFGHITLWNIVPPDVYRIIFDRHIKGKGRIYYHDPAVQTEQHLFAVTVTTRIKTYRVEDPKTIVISGRTN